MTYANITTLTQLLEHNFTPGHPRRGLLTGNEVAAIEAAITPVPQLLLEQEK